MGQFQITEDQFCYVSLKIVKAYHSYAEIGQLKSSRKIDQSCSSSFGDMFSFNKDAQ